MNIYIYKALYFDFILFLMCFCLCLNINCFKNKIKIDLKHNSLYFIA